jgi:hypothetical protein
MRFAERMKKLVTITAICVVAFSTWFTYSKITQGRRDAAYQGAMAPFQHDLPIGTTRATVENYLESRKVESHRVRFGGDEADSYEIQIGTEPSSLFCEEWRVYVVFEFNATDKLKNIRVAKIGTCL